jgi:hypothetical protein
MFTDLTPDPDGQKPILAYLLREYLEFDHKEQITDTNDQSDDFRLIFKLRSREFCR